MSATLVEQVHAALLERVADGRLVEPVRIDALASALDATRGEVQLAILRLETEHQRLEGVRFGLLEGGAPALVAARTRVPAARRRGSFR